MPWGQTYQGPTKPKFDWAGFVTNILQGIGHSGGRTGNMWSDIGLGISGGLGSWKEEQEQKRLEAEAKAEQLRKEQEQKDAEAEEERKRQAVVGEEADRRRQILARIKETNPQKAAEGEFRINEKGFDEWAAKTLFPEPEAVKEPKEYKVDEGIFTLGPDGKPKWLYKAPPKRTGGGEDDKSNLTRGKAEDLAADKAKRDWEAAVVTRSNTPKGAASPVPDDYDYYLKRARESYGLPPLGGQAPAGLPKTPDLSDRGGRKIGAAPEQGPPSGLSSDEARAERLVRAEVVSPKDKEAMDALRAQGLSWAEIAKRAGLM